MKTNTALLWIGLFTLAGAVTISCGGTSDDSALFTAGTTSAAGTSATAGANATGGTTSRGGTTSNTAGTNGNTAGTNNNTAGTNSNTAGTNNNTAGTSNNNGGTSNNGGTGNNGGTSNNGGRPGTGGEPDPGGGAGDDGCPATMPANGAVCMQGDSPFQGCDYGDMNCRCRRVNGGQMRAWQCQAAQGTDVVCPPDAMDGDPCTGQGMCAGQQCFCNNQETNCF